MEPITLGTALLEIFKELGIFSTIRQKLVNDPEEALGKLETVIEEISKIYLAMDTELGTYLSLYFDKDHAKLQDEIKQLRTYEGYQLQQRLNVARGHCAKIAYIYDKHLCKVLPAFA